MSAACQPAIGFPLAGSTPAILEDALREPAVTRELAQQLALTPEDTAAQVAVRLASCQRGSERARLFELFELTGAAGIAHLSQALRTSANSLAARSVGLLSRYALPTVQEALAVKLPRWKPAQHEEVIHQLATAATPGRGRLLAKVFSQLDKRVLGEAVDEIGMSQEPLTVSLLLRLARGEALQSADSLVRVKAIEALGRLRATAAAPYLRSVLESRGVLGWEQPAELRVVAAQAMAKIDPEWMRDFQSRAGLPEKHLALAPLDPSPEAPWARQRRYARVPLKRPVTLVAETMRGECRLTASVLSLGGGSATAEAPLHAGSLLKVTARAGLRRITARVRICDSGRQVGFEFIEMGLEDRHRLRRLIASLQAGAA